MAFTQKDNSGALFKNDRKEKDTQADYKGTAKIDGVEYWLNAWINESRDGKKYMSLLFNPKEERREPKPKVVGGTDYDDEIPF